MKRKGIILTSAFIFALSISLHAQTDSMSQSEEGWRKYEVSVNGGLSLPSGALKTWNDSLGAKTGLNFGANGGYFFNDKICLGGYFTYTQFPMKLYKLHYKLYSVGAYAKYAFTGHTHFEPYIKIRAGADFAKLATWIGPNAARLRELSYGAGLNLAAYIGSLYYTSDFGGIFLEAGYNFARLKNNSVENGGVKYKLQDNINYIDVKAGINVFFGPEQ